MSRAMIRSERGLHALDPDLPFLATEVAVDIDNFLIKGKEDYSQMHVLANLLRNSLSRSGEDDDRPRLLLDLATLNLIEEASKQKFRDESKQEIENLLIQKANRIVEILADPPKNRDYLPEARDFCLALSKAAMAYRALIDDMDVIHFF